MIAKPDNDGRKVQTAYMGEGEYESIVNSGDEVELNFYEYYYGDRTECWIAKTDKKTGIELSRFNAKYISMIIWAVEK